MRIAAFGLAMFLLAASSGNCQDSLSTAYLEEVVITGQFEPQSARRSVFQVRSIALEQIKARGAVRLQDVLNTELNIRFTQDAALGGSNLTLQGLSGQNIKILVDGVPVVGRQGTTNEINFNQFNINSIERIEIVEGPMSVVYGADALAGVINIITKKEVDGKWSVTAGLHEETVGREYGDSQGIHNPSLNAGYNSGPLRLRTEMNYNRFGGWQGDTVGREKEWHPKDQFMISALTGLDREAWNGYYRFDYLFEDIYNPAEFQGGEALDQHYYTSRFMHQLQGSVEFSKRTSLNTATSYTDYSRRTQSIVVDESTGGQSLAQGEGLQDETRFDGLTLRSTLSHQVSDKLSLQPGIDLNYEWGSGGRIKAGTQEIGDIGAFASLEWKLGKHVQLRPGLRLIYNTVYDAPPMVPSLNAKVSLGSHDLRIAYGRGFRAPSIRELYFDFFDASHAIEGNPDLEAELSHNFNGSWSWHKVAGQGLTYTSTVGSFYNAIDNMIGFGQKPGNALITTYLNIDEYKTTGITWTNSLKHDRWSANAGWGVTGRSNELTEDQTSVGEFLWSPEITGSFSFRTRGHGPIISLYYKFTGKTPYYLLTSSGGTPELAELESYHWADISGRQNLGDRIELTAGIRNLFDITDIASSGASTSAHGGGNLRPVGYGRSFFLTLNYSITKQQ